MTVALIKNIKQSLVNGQAIARDRTSTRQPLRLFYAPSFSSSNPYQQQLADHLEDLGVQVQGIDVHEFYLPTAIQDLKPDIIHLHWLDTFFKARSTVKSLLKLTAFIFGLLILRMSQVKLIWTVHNLRMHEISTNRWLNWMDQICTWSVAKLSNAIIVHGNAAKAEVASCFKLSTAKINVIPHANYIGSYENTITRTEARKSFQLDESDAVFLFLGHIRPYKGVMELIESFKKINHKHVKLIIAGKTLTQEIADQIVSKAEDASNIHLKLESIPDDQIQRYMNACDAVVFPYRYVMTSGAVILAMSFGKACIAPRIGCIAEALQNQEHLLYDNSNPEGLFKAMEFAINNASTLPMVGEFNLNTVVQWDWQRVSNKTLEVYQKAV